MFENATIQQLYHAVDVLELTRLRLAIKRAHKDSARLANKYRQIEEELMLARAARLLRTLEACDSGKMKFKWSDS